MHEIYRSLQQKLDSLPNGFPETPSGVELRILEKIFTPEEAEMALQLRPIPEPVASIAERLGKPEEEMTTMLKAMVEKGQIASLKMFGARVYTLVPYVVGIYEFQLRRMDKEFAELNEEYAPALMKRVGGFTPALTKVIPINAPLDAEHQVLRHQDVRRVLDKAKSFQVMECICTKERGLQGEECKHTKERCLSFSRSEDAFDEHSLGRVITKEEAVAVLEQSEKEGLVHTSYNVQAGHMYICNCCPCCCGILRGINNFHAPYLLAKSDFVALIDQDTCVSCGVCADERCPVTAITEAADAYKVDPTRCIGCGACTTGCEVGAVQLVRKPSDACEAPPKNLMDWYARRAESRDIKIII